MRLLDYGGPQPNGQYMLIRRGKDEKRNWTQIYRDQKKLYERVWRQKLK